MADVEIHNNKHFIKFLTLSKIQLLVVVVTHWSNFGDLSAQPQKNKINISSSPNQD